MSRRVSRSRSRGSSPELPENARLISESDYFLKAPEFRIWLKDSRGKYFDELSSDRARHYFRKFVKAWNRGKLSTSLYRGIDPTTISARSQTAYQWSFASKQSRAESDAVRAVREEVGASTNIGSSHPSVSVSASTSVSRGGRLQGPALPSSSDLAYAREIAAEQHEEERSYKRKRDRMEAKERTEDMVGPKEVGKEGMLEKKRARRENDKAFRERGDEGFEADESTLLGGGDSFRDAIARRDAAKRRHETAREEKAYTMRERANMLREKEKATMDMFQQLAKQRFG